MSIDDLLKYSPEDRDLFYSTWLGYTESYGNPELRKWICTLYHSVNPSEILVHSGAQEAIYSFFQSFFESGDHIVVLTPTYQSLYSIAKDRGLSVSEWHLKEDDQGWSLDVDELKSLIKPSTKAVILNLPNNPTGFLPNHDKFKMIVDICRAHGVYLFLDEVYRGLERDASDRLPAICDFYEKGISLCVLSKTYGLAGLRIGWVATRCNEVIQKMAAFKDYLTICSSAPSEFLATVALKHSEKIAQKNRELVQYNVGIANSFFQMFKETFNWKEPKAGPVTLVKFLKGNAEEFCNTVREKAGILLLPSTVYDYGNQHFRLGLGRKNFKEGMDVFSQFYRSTLR